MIISRFATLPNSYKNAIIITFETILMQIRLILTTYLEMESEQIDLSFVHYTVQCALFAETQKF